VEREAWRIELSRRAERDLRRVPGYVEERIFQALQGLTTRPWTGDIERIQGSGNVE